MLSFSRPVITLSTISLLLSACSFVEVKPGAESIILANDENSCERLGSSTVSVIYEFGFISRSEETVEEELQVLAQNAAFKMGGNAIWPESGIEDGERSYTVFRCKPQ